ncbi:MAG: prolipoprotein diacylglyceryl transferase [Spirochaetae bacterium HGW-Spirochaetae-5]|nr:MAG: prolipoprotein diacylglyceryl transferase [Spirochaetae bacterium HGW-Spirochaetae-5]
MNWNIDPEIINLGGLSLRYYSFLFLTGLMLSILVLKLIFKQENIPADYLDRLSLYTVIGVLAGARIAHTFFYEPSYYLNHPLEILLPIQSSPEGTYKFSGFQGLASHGGIAGMFIALYFYSKKTGEQFIKTMDLMAIAAPLGGAFIRIGNFMNSEIIGIPSTLPWAVVFLRNDNIPRHPAQLYESLCYLSIFLIMIIFYKTKREKAGKGFFIGLVLVLIFTARFIIEFVKEKQVPFEEQMKLDMGQLLSIPFIFIGFGFLIMSFIKAGKMSDINRSN